MFFNLLMAKAKKKAEYTELAYLESTGTQWIDTGIVGTENISIETGFEFTTTDVQYLFGSSVTYNTNTFCLSINPLYGKLYRAFIGATTNVAGNLNQAFSTKMSVNNAHFSTTQIRLDDEVYNITTTTPFTTPTSMYLFAKSNNGKADYFSKVKVKFFKIYDNGVLVRDLIPVLDKNLVPCMYDKVSGKYFYNQGDGEFKWKLPNQLEYLESTGTQYIDTGFIPNENQKIEVIGYSPKVNTGVSLVGTRNASDYNNRIQIWSDTSGYFSTRINSSTFITDYPSTVKSTIVLDIKNKNFTINNSEAYALNYTGSLATNNYFLFLRNNGSGGVDTNYADPVVICSFKIWESDKLIQYLIPVFDENLTPCMYDLVSKKYFYNKGTEQFKGYFEDGSQLINYLESDGNQWIDTGFVPSNNTRVVGSVLFDKWLGSANYAFGVYGDNANFGLNVGSARTYFNVPWYNNSGIRISVTPSFNTIYSYDISKDGLYMNGLLFTDTLLASTFQATKTMFIGWCNGTTQNKMSGRIYPHKIYENDVLVQYLIPVLDESLIPCMYDLVSKQHLRNQGTGSFKGSDNNSLIV